MEALDLEKARITIDSAVEELCSEVRTEFSQAELAEIQRQHERSLEFRRRNGGDNQSSAFVLQQWPTKNPKGSKRGNRTFTKR